MDNWQRIKIRELGRTITGHTPSKNNPEDWGNEMLFVTPTDFKNYRKFASDSERKLSSIGISRHKNKLVPPDSVLVTCIGSDMGKVVTNKVTVLTNQQINSIVPERKRISGDFLYYSLVNNYDILRIYGGDGTAVPIVNKSDFESIEIDLPPLPEQRAIASVLSSLDDKIDLLHRENKTLERMAEALFRQWFVEEASDDWEEVPLSDVCVILNGFAFKSKDYREEGIRIIRTLNFMNGFIDLNDTVYIDYDYEEDYDKYQLRDNDFLMVMVGANLGNFAIVTSDILPALQNQNMWNFRATNKVSQHYLNYALINIIKDNIGSASGSAREFFQKKQFYSFNIKVPPLTILEKFDYLMNNFFLKMKNNRLQIQTLEKLRDILLPKLMSGEVRVTLPEEST